MFTQDLSLSDLGTGLELGRTFHWAGLGSTGAASQHTVSGLAAWQDWLPRSLGNAPLKTTSWMAL